MKERQIVYICGRPKQVIRKRGQEYTRKGYDIEISEAEKFRRKCQLLGYSESQMIAKMVKAFNISTGCGEQVKSAGALFEHRAGEHIKEAVGRTLKDEFMWSEN